MLRMYQLVLRLSFVSSHIKPTFLVSFPDKKGGAWLPRKHDVSPYLQIDLGHVTTIQQVATQGNPDSAVRNERHKRWVTRFSLEFSQDGNNWTEYLESGELKVKEK